MSTKAVQSSDGSSRIILSDPTGSTAEVLLFGGQVVSWKNEHREELLFMSSKAIRKPPKAIRGGIPICFPQFSNFGSLERHGFARNRLWSVDDCPSPLPPSNSRSSVDLVLKSTEDDLKTWPHRFELRVRISLSAGKLTLIPRVRNTDTKPFSFMFSLRNYLPMSDISEVRVEGLETLDYFDNLLQKERCTEQADAITFDGEESDVDSFVDDVLVNGKPWASCVEEALTGSHVFVCAHTSRDKRCGVCGPPLIEKFTEEISARELKDQVFVKACSHVGGHKYAGNLIIFAADSEGKIAGHWYGYVAPGDVPELLDQHIAKGEIIERLWRGKMGVHEEKVEKEEKQELPNGKITEEVKDTTQKDDDSSIQDKKKEEVSSCCQGDANGFTCCREVSSEKKEATTTTTTPVQTAKKGGFGKISAWVGNLEQSDVLAGVGVVTAVATVAVAYSFYKRSG